MTNNYQKNKYLSKKVKPFNPRNVKNVDDLLSALKYCGFQGRNLGKALDILEKMVVDDECLTVLTLSGAMVPAGMGELICMLMENSLIDVLVTTGANIIHDLVDGIMDIGHYIGSSDVDDNELFRYRINRIYDVYLPEENYLKTEKELLLKIRDLFPEKNVSITPSNLLKKLGEKLNYRCILSIAAKKNIPIFVPAFSDSEFALDLYVYTKQEGYNFQFDILKEIEIFGDYIKNAKKTGTLIIGGGVPRNWAQQIFPLLDQLEKLDSIGYDYSVRIHTATEYDGGLSGCTISESKSWGKYSLDSTSVSVWCDATIALPILITGLLQRLKLV
ncbi:MAG: deoxyhypusine synthase family protein [Candidatus Lokiarchaeota archaeon]|nr:deoxyhypusine synthase family protein [Candidatus Lokiarchaeota archaeon]